jgi:hypothetical protein
MVSNLTWSMGGLVGHVHTGKVCSKTRRKHENVSQSNCLQIDMGEMKNGEHQFGRSRYSGNSRTFDFVSRDCFFFKERKADLQTRMYLIHQEKSSAPVAAWLPYFLRFPLVGDEYHVADREQLFKLLLRSFAQTGDRPHLSTCCSFPKNGLYTADGSTILRRRQRILRGGDRS